MNTTIICIGNRLVAADAAGPAVFDRLAALQPLAEGIELVEGGLAGLNLLPLLERGGRVVLVDAVNGYGAPDEIVVLDQHDLRALADPGRYDHNAGLAYVLAVLPEVCEGELPAEMVLVGLEGPWTAATIDRAARLTLTIATKGWQGRG